MNLVESWAEKTHLSQRMTVNAQILIPCYDFQLVIFRLDFKNWLSSNDLISSAPNFYYGA